MKISGLFEMHPGGQTVDDDAVTQKREAGLGHEMRDLEI